MPTRRLSMAPEGRAKIQDIKAFPLLVAALATGGLACAGLDIREAESNLGPKLHAHEMSFEVTASNRAVDPRIAQAVNAAIEQTVAIHGGDYSSERLDPLAYAVALQTGVAPGLQSVCNRSQAGSCCSLFCRVMRTDAKQVMTDTLKDLDREFRLSPFEDRPLGDPTRGCARLPLPQRLQCLRRLVEARPSHVKLGPFVVSGSITSVVARMCSVEAQIAEAQSGVEEQSRRKAAEEQATRERLCDENVREASSAASAGQGDVARASEIWEKAKSSCGDSWSAVHQELMDRTARRAAEQEQRLVDQAKARAADSAPYVRSCTPKPVTWEALQRKTGEPALQTVGNPWLDCHRLGSGRSTEVHCTKRTAPVVGTWCVFVNETLCESDEGRWRNPDDCGVGNVELAKLDEDFCPDFIARNRRGSGAKPALRVQAGQTCAVIPRAPPGCRRTYDPLAHTYLLHCDPAGGR
jgi:hypothetical protein